MWERKYTINRQTLARYTADNAEQRRKAAAPCPKTGGEHEWGIDGAHTNEFCKKCFCNAPSETDRQEKHGLAQRREQIVEFLRQSYRDAVGV